MGRCGFGCGDRTVHFKTWAIGIIWISGGRISSGRRGRRVLGGDRRTQRFRQVFAHDDRRRTRFGGSRAVG